MDLSFALLLVSAGVAAGLVGSMAGLASLFSYPALLAVGLPPITANVTNTVALFSTAIGAAAGSRRELKSQGRRLARLLPLATVGGAGGAALLLNTPAETFELIVPWLIALGSVLLLAHERIRREADRRAFHRGPPSAVPLGISVVLVGVYGGYFGAAAGVLMLAVLSVAATEPLAVTNAVKNVTMGAANLTAAVAYSLLAPVHWTAVAFLAVGSLLGAWLGPAIVRRLPERPLRVTIGIAGIALAVHLLIQAVSS